VDKNKGGKMKIRNVMHHRLNGTMTEELEYYNQDSKKWEEIPTVYKEDVICSYCGGTGDTPDYPDYECEYCGGTGIRGEE